MLLADIMLSGPYNFFPQVIRSAAILHACTPAIVHACTIGLIGYQRRVSEGLCVLQTAV